MTTLFENTTPAEALEQAFPFPELETWKTAAENALKGAEFERTLYAKSAEGLTYKGLYTTRPRHDMSLQTRPNWQMCQFYRDPDSQRAIQEIAHDQHHGLEASELDGRICSPATLIENLKQSQIQIPLYLRTHQLDDAFLQEKLPIQGIFLDPIGHWLDGYTETPTAAYRSLHKLFKRQQQCETPLRYVLQISSLPYAEAGANAVQELSYILGTCVEVFQKLLDKGLSCEEVLAVTRIKTSVGTQFFMDLAKIRALRFLLHRLARVYECEVQPMTLHATTLKRTLSRYDIHNNYLRQTLGAAAAVLGGVDGLCTGAFNEINGVPDRYARRMARNIQLVLKHEAYFAPLLDPAKGSFFLENLTHELAEAAWKHFQNIEKCGGVEMQLRSGRLQQEVAEVAALRQRQAETRKAVIVGTNLYANAQEQAHNTHILPSPPMPDYHVDTQIEELRAIRPAEAFETLRENPAWKNHFFTLLRYGSAAAARPRVEFMDGIFASIGVIPEHSPVLESEDDLVDYIVKKVRATAATEPEKTHEMVLCSSDAHYAELLPDVLERLKKAPFNLRFILAGKPGEAKAAYQKAGLYTAFYRGCNVLKGLESLLKPVKR